MKSQIAKDFDMKSRLRKFADGGAIKEVINRRSRLEQAEAEAMGERTPPPPVRPPEDMSQNQPPRPAAPPPKKGMLRRMLGLRDGGELGDEYEKNKYQQSRLRDGGHVKGKGGPTDDEVGPVMLSDEEYVLPADTVDAIGKDKLDAIRLATHDFKDPKKKKSLRDCVDHDGDEDDISGMADGGGVWEAARNKAKQFLGQTPAAPVAPVPNAPPGMPAPLAAAGAEAGAASKMAGLAKGAFNVAQRGAAAATPLFGFGDYKADTGGVDTSYLGMVRDALREGAQGRLDLGRVGTALSGGAGEAFADSGRGFAKSIDSVASVFGAKPDVTGKYDNFIKDTTGGYLSLRDQSNIPSGMVGNPATAVNPAPSTAREVMQQPRGGDVVGPLVGTAGNGVGRDVLRNAGTSGYQELGTYGGNVPIFGRATTPGSTRMNDFMGIGKNDVGQAGNGSSAVQGELRNALRNVGAQNVSRETTNPGFNGTLGSEADRMFDRREAEIRATYGPNGKGNMTKHLAELDRQRQNASQNAIQTETTRRGQDINAETSANSVNANSRNNLLQTLSQNEINDRLLNDNAQKRVAQEASDLRNLQYKGSKDALDLAAQQKKDQFAQLEKGSADLENAAEKRYGKDSDDAKKFTSFLASTPKELVGQLAALPADQRAQGFEDMFARYEQNKIINNRQENNMWGGVTSQEYDPVAEQRPVKLWEDVTARGLPLRDGLQATLRGWTGGDDKVLVTDTGRAVQNTEMPSDLRTMRIVRDQIADAPRRSKLRDKDKK